MRGSGGERARAPISARSLFLFLTLAWWGPYKSHSPVSRPIMAATSSMWSGVAAWAMVMSAGGGDRMEPDASLTPVGGAAVVVVAMLCFLCD
jgi:hypothetical protein